ncbi:hypothetical protein NZK32_03060 [Cyanobium sp. FGCU-52]|nr:hypothetical protein [Cyanobium sp. FGCU52]
MLVRLIAMQRAQPLHPAGGCQASRLLPHHPGHSLAAARDHHVRACFPGAEDIELPLIRQDEPARAADLT